MSDDEDFLRQIGISMPGRYFPEIPEEGLDGFLQGFLHKRVAIRLHVERVASWDHHKLP